MLLVIALIAFIIVCICNHIANRITLDPIAKIKAALDKVRDGNNNINIISNGSDEISVLCKEFSNMTKGLRERQALSTLISDQALYAIKQGMLKTDTFNGVALVTDIRNFTGISEANDPNEITGMLNMHFAEMTSIISNYGGRIYKYIGDAIEAVFTDDKNDSDVAGRAALAALSMLDKLKEINANRQKSNLFTYKIGIGLKYGTFYSGEVGSMDTRIDYAILGEPLKKAALLESFSKKNPELPIVIDEFVKEKLENSGFILEHLLTEPETKAYIIKKTPEDLKLQNIISSENHTTNNKLEIIDSNVKIGLFYSKHTYSLFFIIATIFFIFFNDCFNIVVKAKDNYLNNKTQNNINRIFEQIKNSEMTNGLFFEYACRKGISQFKKELVKGFSIKQLKPQIDYFIKNNNIDRYLIFDGENEYTENFDIKKLHIQKSNKKTRVSNLSDLLKEAMFFHSDTQKPYWKTDSALDDLRARVFEKEVFITNVSDLDLVRKKITPTNEYIYWDFLYDINNKLPNGKNKPIGYVILLQNTNNKISFSTFAQCITYDPNIFIAIKESNSDIWNFSYDYKKETKPIILNNNTINTNDYVACSDLDQSLHFYDKTYSLIVAAKKQNSDLLTAKLSFVAVFIFLMILFVKIIRKTSFVNKSLSCKLKLILASVAFIPIIALILIYEFYSTEKLSFKQTNSLKDIQSFAQDFENKLFITTPFVLDIINDYSSKKELQKLMKSKTSKKSIEKKINNILKFDNNHIIKTENYDKKGNYDLSDIIITDKNFTFSFNYNSVKTNKANDIGKMFKEAGQGIAAITFTSDKSENELKLMANGAKVEESFELIKSFFGTEIYLKIPHYLDKLNHIEMGSKKVISCMKIIPNLKNPLYMILWVLSFDISQIKEITNNYNKKQKQEKKQIKFGLIDYLKNLYNILTENYKNQYIVEALDLESYGLIDFTDYSPDFNSEVKQISSYKSNEKTTLTGLTRFNGIDIIYDVRDCAETPNYALFTINELSPFHKSIKFQRIVFYASITLIIFFVLLLTNNVTKDIIYPIELLTTGINQIKKENYSFRINLERYDELGILCHSFDNMAKGLEEKELMQKMVSKTAKNETLSNKPESSKKAECILIYVSVPDFGNYIKNISPNIVLSDLKTQVALIANAVINAGGEVDKIMAEKQLIAFHIENELVKQKIEAACSSAKSIIKLAKEGSLPFPVSIGISYGTVVTGFLGVGEKRDFTVIGDPVNVAARIATYGENQVPDCHISEDIYNLAKDKFNSELSGEISLKGKSQPMKLYKLL